MIGNKVFINAWQDSIQEIEKKKQQDGLLFITCRHISTFIDKEDYIKSTGYFQLKIYLPIPNRRLMYSCWEMELELILKKEP